MSSLYCLDFSQFVSWQTVSSRTETVESLITARSGRTEGSKSSPIERARRLSDPSILFRVSTLLFFPKQGYGAWCSVLLSLSSCSLIEHAYLFAIGRCCRGGAYTGSIICFQITKLAAVGRSCWNAFLTNLKPLIHSRCLKKSDSFLCNRLCNHFGHYTLGF